MGCFSRYRSSGNPAQRKVNGEKLLFYLASVKWGEGEKFEPDEIKQWSRKFTGFFNSHVLVLNLS